ncbi:MAG TPA: ABC transporter substrate-binding protein [Xanthobacteraceae bacterium]|jgi:NitT/TauT family transport system substrate-binding protein|nr:ABC transporter substrate-binding protein [Xanthobacteraceae bacterium]
MFDRRRALQTGLATLGSLSVTAPLRAYAQNKPRVKVRYNEVVRSILYTPAYIALAKGFFEEAGMDVTMATAQGGDKSVAVLLSNNADIALIGPESAIYVQISDSPTKIPIFCGLTATDGFMLVGREKVDKFNWNMLKGKEILGFRPGSTPLLYLEAALRQNGLDPQKDVKLMNNVGIPARVGSWLAGQNQYAIFIEPDASQLELDGKAHFLASIGETVGMADYTTFMATDKYIRENPETIQNWTNAIYKGMKWTASAPIPDLVKTLEEFFPGVDPKALTGGAERYRRLKIWKTSPVIDPPAMEKFQDILVQGHVLDAAKRVKFQDLVITEFANKAK